MVAVCVMVLGVAVTGCAYPRSSRVGERQVAELALLQKHAPFQPFAVGCGDVLMVEAEGYPDLDRQVTVAPDGSISLRLLGDVYVAGLTVREVRDRVAELYDQHVPAPRIEVTVLENRSARLYVLGQVARPGVQSYVGQQTLLDAISSAGGVTRRGAPNRVLVVRGDPENPEVFRINLKDIMTKGRVDLNVFLAQNDVVYVPPNRWARIGFAVDNVLFPFTSASSAATTYLAFEQLGGGNNDDN